MAQSAEPWLQSMNLAHPIVVSGLLAIALVARPGAAADATSANYRHRGGGVVAAAASQLQSAGPRFGESGVSVGGPGPVGWSGAVADLTTAVKGFWPIVIGEVPNLDVDGDGIKSYEDGDDDGDGLSDAVESHTGVFVSAGDTGSSAVIADSDGDGFDDGVEVAAGSNPNDANSTPAPSAVPSLSWPLAAALVATLAATSRAGRRRREKE